MDTAVFTPETKPGTMAALNKNTGHSEMCLFHMHFSFYNGVLAPNVPGVCSRKGFLSNRLWIQWELDSFASEPKSISYGLSPEQAAVISWERASFKYPFKSFNTSRERLPWNSLRGKRNTGITKETNKHTCLNKNLRTIRFHAVVSHLFRCENI